MSRQNRRTTLQTLVSEGLLTDSGKRWLTEVMDPFHDEKLVLTGYPDTNVAGSVVQVIRKSLQLSVPGAVGAGNWDCNICMFNSEHTDVQPQTAFGQATNSPWNNLAIWQTTSSGVVPYPAEGIVAYSAVAGAQTFGSNSASTGNSQVVASTDATPYLAQNARVIAKGFEVVNTTADINKQGLVTCYRQPMPDVDNLSTVCYNSNTTLADENTDPSVRKLVEQYTRALQAVRDLSVSDCAKKGCADCSDIRIASSGTMRRLFCVECRAICEHTRKAMLEEVEKMRAGLPVIAGWISTYFAPAPPGTLAQALLLPDAQQWAARDGVYVIAPMNNMNNPARTLRPLVVTTLEGEPSDGNQGLAVISPAPVQASANTQVVIPKSQSHISPFDMVGAYFTGLSNTTTLQVNAVWYIEIFPTPWDSILAPLASKSPGFDPMAHEIYGRAMGQLPTAVPQGMNPMGEWFKNVLDVVRDVAVPVGRAVGTVVPGVGLVTEAVNGVASALRPVAKKAKKRERTNQVKKVSGRMSDSPTQVSGPGSTVRKK